MPDAGWGSGVWGIVNVNVDVFVIVVVVVDLPILLLLSRRIGIIDGRRPIEEAVEELLHFDGGRLAPYPPPMVGE